MIWCNLLDKWRLTSKIMPVYMKDKILSKELALVERELISELNNVEIY